MFLGTEWTAQGIGAIVGAIGAGVYVTSYALMQTGYLRGQSYAYASLVIVGACCVAFSALDPLNPAVVVMQTFYVAISVLGIARMAINAGLLRCTEEERAFIRTHLPDLRPEHVPRLLRCGQWGDLPEGYVLARQDVANDRLYFLAAGEARVQIDGKPVGRCRDCFVGEMTLLTGAPATATVELTTPGRALVFERARLQRLLQERPEIKLAVIAGFADATRALLLRRNREALLADAAE